MGILIDASVLIEHERGRLQIAKHIAGREADDLFLSVITASELLHGVHRATDLGIRARRAAIVEALLARFAVLPVDLATARAHARLRADLASVGSLIGPHDLWLAAACLAHGLSIATVNTREFRRVPGLSLENWADGA